MRQPRLMALVKAIANVAVGYAVAVPRSNAPAQSALRSALNVPVLFLAAHYRLDDAVRAFIAKPRRAPTGFIAEAPGRRPDPAMPLAALVADYAALYGLA